MEIKNAKLTHNVSNDIVSSCLLNLVLKNIDTEGLNKQKLVSLI